MKDKKSIIDFDKLAKENRNQQSRFKEEVRRNENGEVVAYVLKRNKQPILLTGCEGDGTCHTPLQENLLSESIKTDT